MCLIAYNVSNVEVLTFICKDVLLFVMCFYISYISSYGTLAKGKPWISHLLIQSRQKETSRCKSFNLFNGP